MTATIDIRFRVEITKGTPLNTPSDPHLLAFEGYIDHLGEFGSIEAATYRDGRRVYNIGFSSFYLDRVGARTYAKFQYKDMKHNLVKHGYVLDATMHFLS